MADLEPFKGILKDRPTASYVDPKSWDAADRALRKVLNDAVVARREAESEYPWAVENRVVKSPPIALFRDREDAEEYADQSMDLRVIEQTEAVR